MVFDGKKLCGILTELSLEGETGRVDHVVLGLGINVGQLDFPQELQQSAISLAQTGHIVSRPALASAVIKALDTLYQSLETAHTYLPAYRKHCVNLGRNLHLLHLDGRRVDAVGDSIDDTFALVVRHGDGHLETLQSGEVSVQGFYGQQE